MAEARTAGYWGEKILGSDYDLDIEIIAAPHNYVAGEDTAVLEVIEGKQPLPRQKPPFPVTVGLFGKPTSVNNVETLANVPRILLKGADWYRGFGTKDCPGTMLFALNETEEVKNPGIYELPFGTPLRYLIEECGGGLKDGKKIKAIMPGSPSSAYLPADKIDTPLEPNAMREAGSMLGCGVVHIVREGDSIVDEAGANHRLLCRRILWPMRRLPHGDQHAFSADEESSTRPGEPGDPGTVRQSAGF